MFKIYKSMFKQLRETQDALWAEALGRAPAMPAAAGLAEWQQRAIQGLNDWASQAIQQSLALQADWLAQWAERAGAGDLKPKAFAALSSEAQATARRWLEGQQALWTRWARLVGDIGGAANLPGIEQFETVVNAATRQQLELLESWGGMKEFEALSGKEFAKLSAQIRKSMQQVIDAQRQTWDVWLKGATALAPQPDVPAPRATPSAPAPSKPTPAKAAKAESRANPAAPAESTDPHDDDLKQISGIGPALEKKLKAKGFRSLRQIAALSEAEIEELERTVIRFPGRIQRDGWVAQAKSLLGE